MIDTHAHIYLEHFKDDVDEVVRRSMESGVEKILLPNIDSQTIRPMLDLEEKYPGVCYTMMGLHPCSVKEDFEKELELVEEWAKKHSFIAIGEIGTDLYWDKTFWEQQKIAFRFQCELAISCNLPIVVHCRETIDETIALVEPYISSGLRGVFHCFTGSVSQAEKITNMGMYLGLGGVSTFKNGGMKEVIPDLDQTKILLETDSPYLSPVPHRGKRNEPAYLKNIAEKIAEYLGISSDHVDKFATENTKRLFFPK